MWHEVALTDIVDLASQGFLLAGGRVAVVDRIPAPTLVYRHNEHLVAVTELPPDAPGGAPGRRNRNGQRLPRRALVGRELRLRGVSDMDEKTLAEFVAALRAARKPAAEETR